MTSVVLTGKPHAENRCARFGGAASVMIGHGGCRNVLGRFAIVAALSAAQASADDYFWTGTSSSYASNYFYCLDDNENDKWAPANGDGDLTRHPTAGNCYWIIDGSYKAGNYTSTVTANVTGKNAVNNKSPTIGGTLCIGSPAGHPLFGPEMRRGNLQDPYEVNVNFKANIDWYNGAIKITGQYNDTFNCVINVKDGGEGAIHQIGSSKASKTNGQAIYLTGSLSSETTNVNISIMCDATCAMSNFDKSDSKSVHVRTSGDNSGYRGTFSCESAFYPFIIGGTHPLGSPNDPNPAALTLCDNGAFKIYDSGAQSAARGIRLMGDTGWLLQPSGNYTLTYGVSKAEGVAGTFVKAGKGTNTLNCAYSAGDIVVSNGLLRVGTNATFPAGQRFRVLDGAKLFINSCPGLVNPVIETVGTGSYSVAEGYRLTDGEWEVRVSAAAVGGGSVTPGEAWVKMGEVISLSAIAGADEFICWTGSTAHIVGRGVFASDIMVTCDEPLELTAKFGALERPADFTCDDGTTYAFADRVLRINVPEAVTNLCDYAPFIVSGYVTQVVKQGLGALQLAAAEDYRGDFEFSEGEVLAGGVGVLGANDAGTIRLLSGAVLTHTKNTTCATGKFARLAGMVQTFLSNGETNPFITDSDIVLDGDLLWKVAKAQTHYLPRNCTFDFAGSSLSISSPYYTSVYLDGIAFTNSSETAVTLSAPTYDYTYLTGNTSFHGGPQNVLDFDFEASLYIQTDVDADWTLTVNSLAWLNGVKNSTANGLDNIWRGTLNVASTYTSYGGVQFNHVTDSVVAFAGPVTGSGLMPIKGGIVNFCCASNSFQGTVSLESSTSSKLRSAIYVWDGAKFSAGAPVEIDNGDFHFGTRTPYEFGDFVQTGGTCSLMGGPAGDEPCGRATMANLTKSGGSVLVVDSPVVVTGDTLVSTGTLALAVGRTAAQLPVFSNLVFAAGTTFDMNGNDLEVPRLAGLPAVANPGALTITGRWTIDCAELKDGRRLDLGGGKLIFAEGAIIEIMNLKELDKTDEFVIGHVVGEVEGTPKIVGGGLQLRLRADGRLVLVSLPTRIIFR